MQITPPLRLFLWLSKYPLMRTRTWRYTQQIITDQLNHHILPMSLTCPFLPPSTGFHRQPQTSSRRHAVTVPITAPGKGCTNPTDRPRWQPCETTQDWVIPGLDDRWLPPEIWWSERWEAASSNQIHSHATLIGFYACNHATGAVMNRTGAGHDCWWWGKDPKRSLSLGDILVADLRRKQMWRGHKSALGVCSHFDLFVGGADLKILHTTPSLNP
jgi:hypothetical protein